MIPIQIYGRLTRDPEISQNANCTNMNVACDSSRMDDNHRPIPQFFRVSVFGKRGETCAKYLHKGDGVFVAVDFTANEYIGRDNQNHVSLNIRAYDIQFAGKAKRDENEDDDVFGG